MDKKSSKVGDILENEELWVEPGFGDEQDEEEKKRCGKMTK